MRPEFGGSASSPGGVNAVHGVSPVLVAMYGEVDGGRSHVLADGSPSVAQVSFASEGADFDPDLDRDGAFLVFASTQHRATADIYRKSVTGTTVTQLTDDPANDMMPSISPDGSRIAFASDRSGNWDIYVMPAAGGRPIQVSSDPDQELHPTWSPDGKMLAYCKHSAQSDLWELWVTEVENPSVRHFIAYGLFPQWSPDPAKSRILFQRARERGSRLYGIWTIDYVGGEGLNPTEIVSASNAATMHPSWSPDGRRIAFTVVIEPDANGGEWPARSEIWTVNLDGSGRTPVVEGQCRNVQPYWGADGRVYFVSNRSGVENIWAALPLSGVAQPAGYAEASTDGADAN
ncbi:MAG: PD40 domain-containing protein [Phycisphaerales bacterium]|nr:PD40 domain-containing protein [Phycisphaerales bacterium]